MKRKGWIAAGIAGAVLATLGSAPAQAEVIADGVLYDSTVSPLPGNLPSLGYQATQTSEFGDTIALAGTDRALRSVTVTFSTWAKHSTWPDYIGDSWSWPITVNVYEPSASGVGDLLGTVTEDVSIPWRPESGDCGGDDAWSDGTACYHGLAFDSTFVLSAAIEVPDEVVVTVAYDTQSYGADPAGVSGPYNSLNVALRDVSGTGAVPVGTDIDGDAVVWNTANAAWYADGGPGGSLREDTNWAPYTPAFALNASAGDCGFVESAMTLTLVDDCTTDETIAIPAGYTLDGAGHSITAVDPVGGHFVGAVVTNAAAGSWVGIEDLTVTAEGLANRCDSGVDRLRGILIEGSDVTIDGVTVTGVRQGLSGCQEGNAIEVRNFEAGTAVPAENPVIATVRDSVVTDYQKNGITLNGAVSGSVTGNTVTGDGPAEYTAQNGIQIGFGASALVEGNTVSGNSYAGDYWTACGVLLYQADGVKQKKNTLEENQKDMCNYGRGGGNVSEG